MTTAIIAEDEDLLREEMVRQLNVAWPDLDIVAVCEDGASALEEISEKRPDIAFLDIRMPGLTGLDVARALSANGSRTHVVFVTAYQQHAIEAFEQGAVDYLLKPVVPERLAQTVKRLKEKAIGTALTADALTQLAQALKAQPVAANASAAPLRWITAGVGNETRLIMVEDILYIQADNKYSIVMTAEGESVIRKPIKDLVAGLDPEVFWQIHRSTIVNIRAVKSIARDDTGKGVIRLKTRSETLNVSQPFMHLFRNM
ncbi:MAG: LytTR family DNA-binding domain-containing protein [Burkholderiales bacterium]|nr:LytTR family DNA-binding domain-containing protein [Burkholderiales bacterium]